MPGKVWVIVLRMSILGRSIGITRTAVGITAMYEAFVSMGAGAMVGVLLLFTLSTEQSGLGGYNLYWVAPIALLPVGLVGLNRFVNRVNRWRKGVHAKQFPRVKLHLVLGGLLQASIGWFILGLSLWMTLRGLRADPDPLNWDTYLHLTSINALAYVIGFVAFFMPAGAGFRELALQTLLTLELNRTMDPTAAAALAAVTAIVLRLIWTTAELDRPRGCSIASPRRTRSRSNRPPKGANAGCTATAVAGRARVQRAREPADPTGGDRRGGRKRTICRRRDDLRRRRQPRRLVGRRQGTGRRATRGSAASVSAGTSARPRPCRPAFREARGARAMTLDADLQDDPAEIPHFLSRHGQGLSTWSAGGRRCATTRGTRCCPSRVFNGMVSWLTGVKLHDHNCGMKAYARRSFREVRLYGEMHRFIPVLAAARGFRVGELVIKHRPRQYGHSKYGLQAVPARVPRPADGEVPDDLRPPADAPVRRRGASRRDGCGFRSPWFGVVWSPVFSPLTLLAIVLGVLVPLVVFLHGLQAELTISTRNDESYSIVERIG